MGCEGGAVDLAAGLFENCSGIEHGHGRCVGGDGGEYVGGVSGLVARAGGEQEAGEQREGHEDGGEKLFQMINYFK